MSRHRQRRSTVTPAMLLSSTSIQAEYQRLGHTLGWRFLTCPEENIGTASVALITINPGGASFEAPRWSVEEGSAYAIERWKGCAPGQETLHPHATGVSRSLRLAVARIARAMILKPRLVVLDEPTAALRPRGPNRHSRPARTSCRRRTD